MHLDLLIVEIGSTTTVASGFVGLGTKAPRLAGQGLAPTSVESHGDVGPGLEQAIASLAKELGEPKVSWSQARAASSAAGGLKMTVHGLVPEMTARAAKEAALGAGAVVRLVTAGELLPADLEAVRRAEPNLVLLAGGVDYGERKTVLANARHLAGLWPGGGPRVIFAGNCTAQAEALAIFAAAGLEASAVANVYPRLDELNIEPSRRALQAAFEGHITEAPGLAGVRGWVDGPVLPTPGAVHEAARLLAEHLGDLVVLDVGGATTDVHSVTDGSPELARLAVAPEPRAKRTVEGDLGVYVNAPHLAALVGPRLEGELGFDPQPVLAGYRGLPTTAAEVRLVEGLTASAARLALGRHGGRLRHLYGATGRRTLLEGKDLSAVGVLIGTGGPLTQLPRGKAVLEALRGGPPEALLPPPSARVLLDRSYLLAAVGLLVADEPKAALQLALASLM